VKSSLNIEPLTGVLGARLSGIDLKSDLDKELLSSLRAAICEFEVLIVPDQSLTPKQQAEFSHLLGPYSPVPFVKPIDEHTEVIKVVKENTEPEAFNFGGVWHSDFSFLPVPPAFTILYAIDVPSVGGDTVWASNTAAYSHLDGKTQMLLNGMNGIHSASASYSPDQQDLHSQLSNMTIETSEEAKATQEHPLVCKHPETGKPSLFFNPTYVRGLKGPELKTKEEEENLMKWLNQWTTGIQFTFRHKWSSGDLVIWDNRSTQHIALNDYKGERRELNRTTASDSIPPSPH
jgi:taurine dioxygenase